MKFKFGKHYTNQVFTPRHKNDTQQSADEAPFAAEKILLAKPLSSADAAGELTSGAPAFGSSAPAEVCQRVLAPAKKAELREIEEILRKAKAGFSGAAETPAAEMTLPAAGAAANAAATEVMPAAHAALADTPMAEAVSTTATPAAENAPASGEKVAEEGAAKAAEGQTISFQNGEESGSSHQQKEEISSCQSEETISCHQGEETVVSCQSEEKLPCRRWEEKGKRGVCEKHYALSNGSFEAVVYAAPVHKKNEKTGEFSDIESGIYRAEDGFSTGENVFDGKFAKTTAGGALFTLKKQGCEFRFLSADAEKEAQGVSVDGAVVYPDFQKGADLLYRVTGNRVKEDVVINERAEKYEYDFKIETDGLAFALSEKRDALLFKNKKDGNVLFVLPVPVMEDAAGAESYDVYYDMQETASGFAVKVVASADWINDEARVFPVRIDPQVMVPALDGEEKNIQVFRASYNEGFMHAVSPGETTVQVGKQNYGNSYLVYYKIRFPKSLIESDKMIESATLNFSVLEMKNSSSHYKSATMEVTRLKAQICDGYGFRSDMPGEKMGEYEFENGYNFSLPFDVEELNQKLAVGECTYYLELKNAPLEENEKETLPYWLYFDVPTEYHPTAAPTLHVTYRNANQENEDHISEYGAGSAGKVGVNLLSGNKTYTHVDVPAEGKLLTSVEHRFNERRSVNGYDCDVEVMHGKTMKISPPHCMGSGWKLNLQRYLVNRNRGNVLDEQVSVLKYADERGAVIPFYEKMYYEKDGQRVFVTGDKLKKDVDNQPVTDENGRFIVSADGLDYAVQHAYFDKELNIRILLGEGKAHFFNLVQDAPDKKLYYYYDADMKKVSVEPNEKGVFSYKEGYFIYNGKTYIVDLNYTVEKSGKRVFQVDGVDYSVSVITEKKKICYEQGLPCFYRIRQEKVLCNGKTDSQATELSAQNEIVYLIPDGLSACAKYMTEEIAQQVSAIAELRSGIKQTESRIDALKKDKDSTNTDIAKKIADLQEEYEAKAKALQEREIKMQQQELESRKTKLSAQQKENDAVIGGMQQKANQLKPDVKNDPNAALYDDYTYVYSSATGQYVGTEDKYNEKYEDELTKNYGNGMYSPQYLQQKNQALQAKINVHEQYKQYQMSIDRLNDSQTEITSALNSIAEQEQYYQAKTELDNLAADIAREQKLQEKTTTEERNAYYDEQIAAAEQDLSSLQDQKFTAENKLRNLLAQEKKEVLDFMVDGSGKYFGFDYYGRLCAIGAGEKKFNRIVWREDNKIDSITDENGATLVSFLYEDGMLSSIFDVENRETHFSYEAGNLTCICYPETVDAEGKKPGATTSFTYANGVMTQIKDRMEHAYEFTKTATDTDVTVVVTEKAYNDTVDENDIISASQAKTGTVETVIVDLDKHTAKLKGPAETVRIAYDPEDNELYITTMTSRAKKCPGCAIFPIISRGRIWNILSQ